MVIGALTEGYFLTSQWGKRSLRNSFGIVSVDLNKIGLGKIWKGVWFFPFFHLVRTLFFRVNFRCCCNHLILTCLYDCRQNVALRYLERYFELWKKKDAGRKKIKNSGGWHQLCRPQRSWFCAAICVVGVHNDFVAKMLSIYTWHDGGYVMCAAIKEILRNWQELKIFRVKIYCKQPDDSINKVN